MKEVIALLKENPMGFLATVDNGEPRVRPWGFMFEQDGRFYFCTNNTKPVYRQLTANPRIEFATLAKTMTWVRLRGPIVFTEDLAMKEKVLAANDMVRSIYKTADNPIFKVFYVEHGTASIADFSGAPPRNFDF